MNEIDCKIVLEEYLLLHEAYENLELEYGGASACEEGRALLNQAKTITGQPLQVSKWNKETQALLATAGVRQGRAAQKRRKVESECGGLVLDFAWLQQPKFTKNRPPEPAPSSPRSTPHLGSATTYHLLSGSRHGF